MALPSKRETEIDEISARQREKQETTDGISEASAINPDRDTDDEIIVFF